jgi:hypothetical protein
VQVGVQATLRQRSNFAVQHMMAASRFARLCHKVEQDNIDLPLGPFYDEILSYVTATLFLSVAALESNINEIFADAQDGMFEFEALNVRQLSEIWQLIEKKPILEKYQFALVINGKDRMGKGISQYECVDALIKARNALVHFKPEWHDDQEVHDKIGKRLKFNFSPFIDENSPVFPVRCMTHGFAAWAIRSSLDFAQWYSGLAGLPNRFAQFMEQMDATVDNVGISKG